MLFRKTVCRLCMRNVQFFVKSYSIKNKVKEVAGDCQLATKVTDK